MSVILLSRTIQFFPISALQPPQSLPNIGRGSRQLDKIVCNRSEAANGMKLPGLERPIAIARNANRVRVTFAGQIIADTTRALTLREAGYPPVQYIPRADVVMRRLIRTARASTASSKATPAIFRSSLAGPRPTMRRRATRSRCGPWPRLSAIWRFIQTAWTRLKRFQRNAAFNDLAMMLCVDGPAYCAGLGCGRTKRFHS
jgi:uncharacterized protein (DUF427 family)